MRTSAAPKGSSRSSTDPVAEQTGIEWCDATFNPWLGCSKVSPGCARCYAETLVSGRMGRPGTWGDDGVRQRTSLSNWKKPLRWARLAREGLLPDGSENKDGHRPRIFCASLADVFEERPVLDTWRRELFELIAASLPNVWMGVSIENARATPELDWLVLTKRPEYARDWLTTWCRYGGESFTWRADVLREIPAAVRFLSCEPLLGSLYDKVTPAVRRMHREDSAAVMQALIDSYTTPDEASSLVRRTERTVIGRSKRPLDLTEIDWVIVGGESGPRARPMSPKWARELRDACLGECVATREHRPAFFFKQWGEWAPASLMAVQTRSRRGRGSRSRRKAHLGRVPPQRASGGPRA